MDKNEFFQKCTVKRETYHVDDNVYFEIHELSLSDRDAVQEAFQSDQTDRGKLARVVVAGCDLFSEDDIPQLMQLPETIVLGIANRIFEISGMSEDEAKKKPAHLKTA
jgi:hypothetical protein